jgi:hypothetical protein
LSRNGKHSPPRPRIEVRQTSASPEEAAAIAAAIEQFLRDTAPVAAPESRSRDRWLRTALLYGARSTQGGPTPWGDGEPWGRY